MAPTNKLVVRLSAGQRRALEDLLHAGGHPAHATRRARILLKSDADGPDAWPDERIAEALDVCRMTITRLRRQFLTDGMEVAVYRRRRPGRQHRKLGGAQRARLVALACSAPPAGHARWTVALLASRLVELRVVESVHPSTVWRELHQADRNRDANGGGHPAACGWAGRPAGTVAEPAPTYK
jgi:hypothetical protein